MLKKKKKPKKKALVTFKSGRERESEFVVIVVTLCPDQNGKQKVFSRGGWWGWHQRGQPVAVHPGLRLSEQLGSKSQSWLLNGLLPHPEQGAGGD